MGTGGTITGTAKFLKAKNPNVQVIGVDPLGSLLYDTFKAGGKIPPGAYPKVYKVEGIGEDFLPTALDFQYIDDVVQVGDRESFLTTRRLVREEGLFCGGSSGTAVYAALQIAKHLEEDKTVVVMLPDSGSRYLSKIFNDDWMRENRLLDFPFAEGRVEDILRHRHMQVITARKEDRKTEVIERMRQYSVSQLPVVEDGSKYSGMITEVDLLNHLLTSDHQHAPDETIEDLINPEAAEVVGPETSLSYLSEVFRTGKVAVVCEEDNVVGIVSKIDLIEYLAGRLR
jgi:cystathionine beta-synthase